MMIWSAQLETKGLALSYHSGRIMRCRISVGALDFVDVGQLVVTEWNDEKDVRPVEKRRTLYTPQLTKSTPYRFYKGVGNRPGSTTKLGFNFIE